jgi:hypothetical protein
LTARIISKNTKKNPKKENKKHTQKIKKKTHLKKKGQVFLYIAVLLSPFKNQVQVSPTFGA